MNHVAQALGIIVLGSMSGACGTQAATALPADAGASVDGPIRSDAGAADSGHVDGAAPPQQIVFMMTGAGPAGGSGTSEIGLANLDGGAVKQLTNDGKFKFLPHFSPDGTKLVYTKFSKGGYGTPGSQSDIALYDFATGTETLLTHNGGSSQATFSPDGKRVAYGAGTLTQASDGSRGLYVVNVDGTGATRIGVWSGAPDEITWGDFAWSAEDWIVFAVAENPDGGCFKVRLDKMLPDGGSRTQIDEGGPNCTPTGFEQSGDADPGWSHDGKTVYSSRGLPMMPPGFPEGGMPVATERKLYAISSDAWYPGKPETDLSLASQPDCIEGVPKGSPDGTSILLFRFCFDGGAPDNPGIYVTDTAGSYRRFVTAGFGPDWNPAARP